MSIIGIRERLDARRSDDGLSMTEVIVALFVFTIFILGLGYSLLSMTRLVSDDENREVAASLAAQEIDRVRAIPDAFNVYSSVTTQTVNGVTYTINRDAGWVSTSGSTVACGGGGGNLQYKSVDVQVTWPTQYILTSPIRSSTILAPATRINDPSYGTIIVSDTGADGTGRAGVAVSVTPVSGTGALAVGAVAATDASGCSYVLKVTPGTYTVTLSKTGYVDVYQKAVPSLSVTIAAGSSQTAPFSYDARATYNVQYASNFTPAPKLPSSFTTNFLSSSLTPYSDTTSAATQFLFPVVGGYSAYAGPVSACSSADPILWMPGSYNGTALAQGIRNAVGVTAGSSGTLGVSMGVIQATWPVFSGKTITVVSAAAPDGTGDPGCATSQTYTFTYTTAPAAGSTVYLAVPFGSWQVYSTVGSVLTILPAAGVAAATRGEVTGTVVTLDPRNP